MAGDPVCMFDKFSPHGYTAGMVLKDPWGSQDEIYAHIRKEFLRNSTEMISPFQTHSSSIAVIGKDHESRSPVADGAISNSESVCLTVRSADCIPLLMIDKSSSFFGAVHIGWRGLVGGIVEELFKFADDRRLRTGDMQFYLGPCIGSCCLEVGHEVAILFDDPCLTIRNDSFFVDLRKAAVNRLVAAGVRESNIDGLPECTSCLSQKYYSYRRDGRASIQMVSFIFRSR